MRIIEKGLSLLYRFSRGTKQSVLGDLEKLLLLRSFLRRVPYWYEGHILFVDEALFQNRLKESYLSMLAAKVLQPNDWRSLFAEGKVMLRAGNSMKAVELLSLTWQKTSIVEVAEEYVAALIGESQWSDAQLVIEKIPVNKRTNALETAYAYCLSKGESV